MIELSTSICPNCKIQMIKGFNVIAVDNLYHKEYELALTGIHGTIIEHLKATACPICGYAQFYFNPEKITQHWNEVQDINNFIDGGNII